MNPRLDLALRRQMARTLDRFEMGKLSLHQLVAGLGRLLERAETLREDWVEGVYGFWTSLDEVDRDSVYELEIDYEKARSVVYALETFLSEQENALNEERLQQAGRRKTAVGHAA
jgi:hypothetical protein